MLGNALWPLVCKPWSCERGECDIIVFITNLASSAALMEASSRVMVQVLLLALVVQVTLSQHWSYGWLPGGKRSVGELEATIRVSEFLCGRVYGFRKCGVFMKFKAKFNFYKTGQLNLTLALFHFLQCCKCYVGFRSYINWFYLLKSLLFIALRWWVQEEWCLFLKRRVPKPKRDLDHTM